MDALLPDIAGRAWALVLAACALALTFELPGGTGRRDGAPMRWRTQAQRS